MSKRQWGILIGILLCGWGLRLIGSPHLADSLNYDEAFYLMDAYSLLENPRLTPFFAGNFGRESAWMYLLASALAVFGQEIFALRVFTALIGLLTIGAIFRLSIVIFHQRWIAIWSAAGLAVLYWHVHFSHLMWRALLFPLVGTLMFASVFHAQQRNQMRDWVLSGILLALLAYTYFAARIWILLAVGVFVYIFVVSAKHRRGVMLAISIAFTGMLPLIVYTFRQSTEANQRVSDVAVTNISDILSNLSPWLRLWFIQGAEQIRFNFPGRPVLDVPLLILVTCGLMGVWWIVRHRWHAIWLLLLAISSAAIALLTTSPENMIRMIGTVIPLALLIGVGATSLQRVLQRIVPRALANGAFLIPLVLVSWAGIHSFTTYQQWLQLDLDFAFERHVMSAASLLAQQEDDTPAYFLPYSPTHPVIQWQARKLAPRPVTGFDASQCLVLPQSPALYYVPTIFDPALAERVSPWAQVETLLADDRDTWLRITPDEDAIRGAAPIYFEDGLSVRVVSPLPDTSPLGEPIDIMLRLQSTASLAGPITAFVHLYGDPIPYDGGVLWAQNDQPVCLSYPLAAWRADERILQGVSLRIPEDTPPADYAIALGFYNTQTQTRLLTATGDSYIIIGNVSVR